MAKLYFRYGAMNSGKSTALMQAAYNYEERDMKVCVLKPKLDKKNEDKLLSRIGIERKVDYLVDDVLNFKKYLVKCKKNNVKCIFVDEAQFLDKEQIDLLFEVSKLDDIPVICYGLKTDFRSELFPGSKRLLELADNIEELITICECGKRARFNARIVDGEYVLHGKQIAIDNIDAKYKSLCGKCYLEKVLKIKVNK